MSYQSETLVIRQYLDPLTPDQMEADYVHTLPSGRKAVNLVSLQQWRSLPVGAEVIRVLPVESTAIISGQQPYSESIAKPILIEGGVLSIRKSGFLVRKHILVPVSGFDYAGRVSSPLAALNSLNRALNVRNQDFPMPSHYRVSYVKQRDKGTIYQIPNNYQVEATESLYLDFDYEKESDTQLLKMRIDDVWHIEAWQDCSQLREYKIYAVMGDVRQGLLGQTESLEEVMTLMLDVAMGTRTVNDYAVEKPHLGLAGAFKPKPTVTF